MKQRYIIVTVLMTVLLCSCGHASEPVSSPESSLPQSSAEESSKVSVVQESSEEECTEVSVVQESSEEESSEVSVAEESSEEEESSEISVVQESSKEEESSEEPADLTGFYNLTTTSNENGTRDIAEYNQAGIYCTMTLQADGSGEAAFFGEQMTLQWDESAITFSRSDDQWNYTLAGEQLTLQCGQETMVFERTDPQKIPSVSRFEAGVYQLIKVTENGEEIPGTDDFFVGEAYLELREDGTGILKGSEEEKELTITEEALDGDTLTIQVENVTMVFEKQHPAG